MNKLTAEYASELAEAVKLFISQPLNFPLSRGQIMEVARTALPILEQQERGEGEWISCTERLPVQYQSNRYVPLTLLLNERTVAQGGFDDGQFWVDGVVMNNVTRWQPMPLPPAATNQNGEQ